MKLEKAIELLQLDLNDPGSCDYNDRAAAQALGIEALERIQVGRNHPGMYWNDRLPGETDESDSP